MTDWLGLDGKRAVVAGAGALGTACAQALAAAGTHLLVTDRDERRLDAVRAGCADRGLDVATATADLVDAQQCRAVIDQAVASLGGLDVFVHALGINERVAVTDLTIDQWRRVIDTNLFSAFALGQAAGAVMRVRGGGRIVFFSSVSGLLAHPHHAAYAASKGGLNQLVKVMAVEWAAHGVGVNAVAPGYTETPLTGDYLARPGMRDELVAKVPAGRLGTVDDVVGPVLFLCSSPASFVTGQVLYVDGGRILD